MSTDLGTRDSPRAGVWEYVSPSRLSLWLKCPLAFKLRYIDGIVTPPSPALFVGRMVHEALECFYRHRQLGLAVDAEELTGRLKQSWEPSAAAENVVFDSQAQEESCRRQTVELVAHYLEQLPADEPRPLAVETMLEVPLVDPQNGEDLGIPLVGVIDLVLAEETGSLVVDFKTAARSAAPLEITHEIQLSAYAYLLRAKTAGQEAGLEIRQLVKTKKPQVDRHRYEPRSEAHFRRLFAVVRAYLDDLDQGRFVFRPGMACQMCEFREMQCRAWGG